MLKNFYCLHLDVLSHKVNIMYQSTLDVLAKQKYDSLYDWVEIHLEYKVLLTRSTCIHQCDWMEGLRHPFALQDSVLLALGSFFLLFCLGLLFVWLDLTSGVVLKDSLCQHTGKCLTDVTCYSQPIMYLSQVGSYGLCVASKLEAPGAEWIWPHTSGYVEVTKCTTQVESL